MSLTMLLSRFFPFALVLTLTTACGRGGAPTNASGPPPIPVELTTLETSTVSDTSEYIGNLRSRRSVTLQPQVQGRISQIIAQPGDVVSAGEVLIQINPDRQEATITSSRAAVAAAEADVENAKASLIPLEADRRARVSDVRLQQQQYNRYLELLEEGAVSQETVDEFRNRLETAQAELNAAEAQITAQRSVIVSRERVVQQTLADVSGQRVELQYYQITAPFAGTVGDIPVKIGDYVSPSTQLLTVTQNEPLEVNVSIPSTRAAELRTGMTVQLLDQQGEVIGDSQIFFISPNVSNQSQSVLIKSLFANVEGRLRADQTIRTRIVWDSSPGILIPTTAITRLGGETFVYVAEEPQQPQAGQAPSEQAQPAPTGQASQGQAEQPQLIARQKPVELGDIQGNNYQVLEGLAPGERVITSGLLNLSDGAPIAPQS